MPRKKTRDPKNLVLLQVELPRDLDRRLRLACAERRAEQKDPNTRTAITVAALQTWLKRVGH